METACVEMSSINDASDRANIVLLLLTRQRWVGAGKSGGRDSKKGVLTSRLFLCDFFRHPECD